MLGDGGTPSGKQEGGRRTKEHAKHLQSLESDGGMMGFRRVNKLNLGLFMVFELSWQHADDLHDT